MNRQKRLKFALNENKEHRWMISYADFLTLLFAFFVFLFSISTLEDQKFKQVSATLLQIFDVAPSSVDPIPLQTTPQGPDMFNPLFQPEPLPGTQIDLSDSEVYQKESSLLDIQQKMGESFSQLIEQQLFSVSGNESWIELQIEDSILFLPGSADISEQAEALLYEIGKAVSAINLPVAVEGYSLPNESNNVADGWALSSARANAVVRYLNRSGVSGARLSAIAFSHYQPQIAGAHSDSARISIVVAGFGVSLRD